MSLSILTVTQGQPYALPFLRSFAELAERCRAELVVVADGPHAFSQVAVPVLETGYEPIHLWEVESKGFIESVLDEAVSFCRDGYVLRLDDDERASPAMVDWLASQAYLESPHWNFPRMHLWPDETSALMTSQLFPDHQTRLSLKEMSGGRPTLHAMSPFGMGDSAPVCIEHHKFLVKSRAEREQIARQWHRNGMTAFSLPEAVYRTASVVDMGDGRVPWHPKWRREMSLS